MTDNKDVQDAEFEDVAKSEEVAEAPQPDPVVRHLPRKPTQEQIDAVFKKHSDRGQWAMQFAQAICNAEGTHATTKKIVTRSFELYDALQAEIDKSYNKDIAELN